MTADNEFLEFLGINKQEMDNRAKLQRKKEGKGCTLCNYTGLIQANDMSEFCSCVKNEAF